MIDCANECHPLTYYIANTTTAYFTSNATFIFMEGEHLLDVKGSAVRVLINDINNLTLRGDNSTNTILRCGNNTKGLAFTKGSMINIIGITITGCGQHSTHTYPITIIDIAVMQIINCIFRSNQYGGLYYAENYHTHTTITIDDSIFSNNSEGGALYLTLSSGTCNNIVVSNSMISYNIIHALEEGAQSVVLIHSGANASNTISITDCVLTGNRGGWSIICDDHTHNIITITTSIIRNNHIGYVISGGGLYLKTGTHNNTCITVIASVFDNNLIEGNGAGMLIHTKAAIHSNVFIANSNFTNNRVPAGSGGGLCLLLFESVLHVIVITNSLFIDNSLGEGNSGGACMHFISGKTSHVTVTDSTFINNSFDEAAQMGGGLYISSSYEENDIKIISSIFNSNSAGMVMDIIDNVHYLTVVNSSIINNLYGMNLDFSTITVVSNVTINFADNELTSNSEGVLLLSCVDVFVYAQLSRLVISNNDNSGIYASGTCKLIFTGGGTIIANNSSPNDGGGIYLENGASIVNEGQMNFINNSALRYGGAIYSSDNDYKQFFRNYGYYILSRPPTFSAHDSQASASFINNSALLAGDMLYGGMFLTSTSNFGRRPDVIDCHAIKENGIDLQSATVHPLSPVSSDPIIVCPCVNDRVNCSVKSLSRSVYPLQTFNISLVTVGLCGGVTPGFLEVRTTPQQDGDIDIVSTSTSGTSTSCMTHQYAVKLVNSLISSTILRIDVVDGIILYNNIGEINISLSILPCPLGLALDPTSGYCVCNNDIITVSEVRCNISWMPYPIQRSGNNWIAYSYDRYNCTIAHSGCPFDYCNTLPVKFAMNASDLQCNHNRSGILCGRCQPGLSLMIGSNKCTNCTDTTLVAVCIVILAASFGIVLVVLLIVLNLTVSIGTINGLLFYANIVKVNESIFFSQGNISIISLFISWANLDLGIEYCFIDGLDGYVKTWLQFCFPVYVWFLVVVIIVACRYSGRLSRLTGRNAVPVLATLILMSYTKLSRTVTNALMMNTLQCGEYKWSVWNVDGNIDYLGLKHAILFTVSLLFLVIGVVYMGLVFSSQWLQRYSGKCCDSHKDPVVQFKPLIDAYTGPFKDKYRFWTGLCLIVRLVLTVVFSFTTTLQPKLNNYIILVVAVAILVFVTSAGVYRDKRLTVLETASLINLVCLCLMLNLFTDESYQGMLSTNTIVCVSVSIEILLLFIISIVHFYNYTVLKMSPNYYCESLSRCCGIALEDDSEVTNDSEVREELIL